jgi:molybdopterin molybdotransferase
MMLSVEQALERVFALVSPLGTETVPLAEAGGRVLAEPVTARRDQPPFPASAMDGYALRAEEARPGASFRVIGESAAGHRFEGRVGPAEAVRIFTGAPLPQGADRVVMQEDTRREGERITLLDTLGEGRNIRPLGTDFTAGSTLSAPRRLRPADLALIAAMNVAQVPVFRRPAVAFVATGDELVMPGEEPGPDQIIASNGFGLAQMARETGSEARLLPIARDSAASLRAALELAAEADMIVTIGGASVGDHDIVGEVAASMGMAQSFYKVAIRPGKPLMAGTLAGKAMLGLPGNPVSSMVCGHVFMLPALRVMMGLPAAPAPRRTAPLAAALPANGPREHYMRARLTPGGIEAFERQDSALLSVLSQADALLIRPPGDGPREAGEMVEYIEI